MKILTPRNNKDYYDYLSGIFSLYRKTIEIVEDYGYT